MMLEQDDFVWNMNENKIYCQEEIDLLQKEREEFGNL